MKALTLWQPWASLVILGHKRFETRGWSTRYRGQLAIHASAGEPREARDAGRELLAELRRRFRIELPEKLPRGAVLGTVHVDLVLPVARVVERDDPAEILMGNYSEGRYAWKLIEPVPFMVPHPARGYQLLWDWKPADDLPAAKPREPGLFDAAERREEG